MNVQSKHDDIIKQDKQASQRRQYSWWYWRRSGVPEEVLESKIKGEMGELWLLTLLSHKLCKYIRMLKTYIVGLILIKHVQSIGRSSINRFRFKLLLHI